MKGEETTQQTAETAIGGDDRTDFEIIIGDLVRADQRVDYAAWCVSGQCRLEDIRPAAGSPDVDGTRRACRRIAERVSFDTDDKLDRRLAGLGTGRLIRTVLASDRGAVYCDQAVPGSYLVGVTIDLPSDPTARRALSYRADQAIADRVEEFREKIHGRRYDLGSWYSEHERELLRAGAIRPRDSAKPRATRVTSTVTPVVTGVQDHPAVRAAAATVRPQDLHLVAVFNLGELAFCVDVLHDAAVEEQIRAERRPSTAERRQWYLDLGRDLPDYLRELARAARGAIGGPLSRAVLDVEDGAVYYRRLDTSSYLIGLTVFQERVFPAERRVDSLMDDWPA